MYYNIQNHTFGHTHTEVARETNSSFAVGELVVGDYRLYEHMPEPEYDAATHRIEASTTITQRTGQPWLRGWDVIATRWQAPATTTWACWVSACRCAATLTVCTASSGARWRWG